MVIDQGKAGARRARGVPAEREDPRAASDGDAPPTNRASHTCNGDWFKPLRWGVDSLYLSYRGRLDDDMERRLERLKKLAQSQEPYEHALAQVSTDGHIFEAKDKGGGLFPFILEDNAFRISLARNRAKSLPMAYAKISSDYLAHVTPHDAELRLGALLRAWGTLMDVAAVSRIDLFLDFVSGFDMEGWNRQAWVTRASAVNAHATDSSFSGWSIGLGGPVAGRLYDKTLEIRVKRN